MAGCGDSRVGKVPPINRLPLVPGASVAVSVPQCDKGADAYCALLLVVHDRRFRSSREFFDAEQDHLHRAGWSESNAQTSDEQAAESPNHSLRVTYATADGDLKGVDLGWIRRPRPIALALSRALFQHTPALSLMLEAGSS